MIRWYQLPAKSIRSLVLVIAMSSHPIKISAGRMIDLSLATFGNVRNCTGRLREINLTAENLKERNSRYPKITCLEALLISLYVVLITDCNYNKLNYEKEYYVLF